MTETCQTSSEHSASGSIVKAGQKVHIVLHSQRNLILDYVRKAALVNVAYFLKGNRTEKQITKTLRKQSDSFIKLSSWFLWYWRNVCE